MPRTRRKSGFTLLELLIIVAVIGILASILLPALAKAREKARRRMCFSNMHQFGLALHLYAQEHGGAYPWSGGGNDARCFANLYPEYFVDSKIYYCPSDPQYNPTIPFTNSELNAEGSYRASFDYLGAWTREPVRIDLEDPVVRDPNIPLVWDIFSASRYGRLASHVPTGGNVLFLDGRVEFLNRRRWHAPNLPSLPAGIEFDPELLEDAPEKWLDPFRN